MWIQKECRLKPRPRGFHLVTDEILARLPELAQVRTGLLHVLIKHTSAALTINENADPTVRKDFESFFNHVVPEDQPYYQHNDEGSDDLPAHLKASLLGASVTIPVTDGQHVAGNLFVRTPQPRRQPRAGVDAAGRMKPRVQPITRPTTAPHRARHCCRRRWQAATGWQSNR